MDIFRRRAGASPLSPDGAPGPRRGAATGADVHLAASVLFAAPVTFTTGALRAALSSTFPDMDWSRHPLDALFDEADQDSGTVVVAQLTMGDALHPAQIENRTDGPASLGAASIQAGGPAVDAAAAFVDGSQSRLNVTVRAPRADLDLRVEAGRRLAAIAWVLAARPSARAVWWHPANRVAAADDWTSAADDLRRGDLPIDKTLGVVLAPDAERPDAITGRTVGLAAYFDAELEIAGTSHAAEAARAVLLGVARRITDEARAPANGDVLVPKGDDTSRSVRLRPEASHPTGVAHWTLTPQVGSVDAAGAAVPAGRPAGRRRAPGLRWFPRRPTWNGPR